MKKTTFIVRKTKTRNQNKYWLEVVGINGEMLGRICIEEDLTKAIGQSFSVFISNWKGRLMAQKEKENNEYRYIGLKDKITIFPYEEVLVNPPEV